MECSHHKGAQIPDAPGGYILYGGSPVHDLIHVTLLTPFEGAARYSENLCTPIITHHQKPSAGPNHGPNDFNSQPHRLVP